MLNPEAATGMASATVGRIASFGKYLLLQRVSVGGMAEVFKAIPEGATRIDQIVAVKRILPNIAEDREFIGMFIDEARIAGQLTHPNICRIYELGRVGGDHYIAMQFLWGRDLLKVMNRYKRAGLLIPPPMAVFIAAHACGALHYAHFKCDVQGNPLHIIHRDVSPQNIIVGYSGQAKLIDFGVARAASQSQKTQAGILKGKFGYMSPEMIRGLPVDHRSDVFAMGICLHEALTGSRLFYGETDFATLELVRDAKIAPPSAKVPSISPELDAIVLRALSRDADERYQTANELAAALDEYLERHHPGYGEADVSASMREAFAHELSREKLRLDAFAQMLERGELVRGAALPALPNDPPPSGERNAISSEQPLPDRPGEKLGSAPAPFNGHPQAGHAYGTPAEARAAGEAASARLGAQSHGSTPDHDDELSDEQTQIFFSAAELNEIRELGALVPLTPTRAPAPSEVIMRSSSGFTTPPPMMAAPSFATLTPSGTYPRRFDEQGRASPEVPAPSHGRFSRDPSGQTQPISGYEGPLRDSSAARIHRDRGTVRSSLLALGALVIAGIGYAAVSLSGSRGTGVLEIGSVGDPDALVRVDGVVRGNPPLNVEGLLPGPHNVEIEARGYEVTRVEVSVGAGATRAVNLVLSKRSRPSIDPLSHSNAAPPNEPEAPAPEPAAPATTAAEKPLPQAAGNKLLARPALVRPKNAEPLELPAGQESESTKTVAESPEPQQAEVEPSDTPPATGETQVGESIDEDAAAAGEGILLISTVPWSRVIIDGSDTGRDTPVRALRVRAGDHLIVLRTPEGEEHNVNVSVAAGRTVRIIRRF
jgi:serine/threonine protein kinase